MSNHREIEDDDVINEGSHSLTFMPWHEHVKNFLLAQWKLVFIFWVGLFGIFWGLIEAISFFYPSLDLRSIFVLPSILVFGFVCSLGRAIHVYRNSVPKGLENESSTIQKIALSKNHYWEYALAYELVKSRIQEIDQDIENLVGKRIYVKITKTLELEEYIDWLQTRPENLLRLVEIAKQLLIFDLIEAIQPDESSEIDCIKLIRTIELIRDAYKSAYEFEIEGHEIIVPEGFEIVHEIQAGWVSVIRDGFHQMLEILQSVATRDKGDFSPVEGTIVFEEPPRVEEFSEELNRISQKLKFENGF